MRSSDISKYRSNGANILTMMRCFSWLWFVLVVGCTQREVPPTLKEASTPETAEPYSQPSSTPAEVAGQEAFDTSEHLATISTIPLPEPYPGADVVDVPPYVPGGPRGYMPIWQCIPPAFRTPVIEADDWATIRPNAEQLTRGLLNMTFMRQPPCVRNLLDGGAGIDSTIEGASSFADGPALHLALNQRNWSLAKYLLERGADPNVLTPYEGYSALDAATASGAPAEVIAALSRRGAKARR